MDETGIHPEIHKQVYEFIEKELGIKKKDLKLPLDKSLRGARLSANEAIQQWSEKYNIGLETLKDVIAELQRPGLDPRDELEPPCFSSTILDITDLKIGDKLDGIIRNVTDFGAFVDIGLHSDGLVHKSQMANYYVTNPIEVVKVGQQVKVKVIDIDLEREKVSLSMKDDSAPQAPRTEAR